MILKRTFPRGLWWQPVDVAALGAFSGFVLTAIAGALIADSLALEWSGAPAYILGGAVLGWCAGNLAARIHNARLGLGLPVFDRWNPGLARTAAWSFCGLISLFVLMVVGWSVDHVLKAAAATFLAGLLLWLAASVRNLLLKRWLPTS